jgi:hypothetical protein
MTTQPKYKYRVFCTHKAYRRRRDPHGKFTFDTNDLDAWKARCLITGVRIDRVETPAPS